MKTLLEKIQRWKTLQDTLKEVKAEEMHIRKELCAELYSDNPEEGSNTLKTEIDGVNVKAVLKQPFYRKVDSEAINAGYDLLVEKLSKNHLNADGLATAYFDSLFKYKPELHLKNYRQLMEQEDPDAATVKDVLADLVITSPGSPSITIELED